MDEIGHDRIQGQLHPSFGLEVALHNPSWFSSDSISYFLPLDELGDLGTNHLEIAKLTLPDERDRQKKLCKQSPR
jgi:hypothetical protein